MTSLGIPPGAPAAVGQSRPSPFGRYSPAARWVTPSPDPTRTGRVLEGWARTSGAPDRLGASGACGDGRCRSPCCPRRARERGEPEHPLRTVDALHLAIARHALVDTVATADTVMADAADAMGLRVARF